MFTDGWIKAVVACWSDVPSASQPPGPDINYTAPREVLLEFVILVF